MSPATPHQAISAALQMDWQQVAINGGPPCFHIGRDGRFCGRAERWEGHNDDPEWPNHEFVTLAELLQTNAGELLDALQTIARGDYDNAHDCMAAAKIARAAIAKAEGAR